MNWKEFMELAEKAGIKDDDEIWFIDFRGDETELWVFKDHRGAWSIS